jgi:hypothetical protein
LHVPLFGSPLVLDPVVYIDVLQGVARRTRGSFIDGSTEPRITILVPRSGGMTHALGPAGSIPLFGPLIMLRFFL